MHIVYHTHTLHTTLSVACRVFVASSWHRNILLRRQLENMDVPLDCDGFDSPKLSMVDAIKGIFSRLV